MAKSKKTKGSIPQRNVHLRLAYLHKAALYFSSASTSTANQSIPDDSLTENNPPTSGDAEPDHEQTRYLVSQLKGVSRKSVIRLQKEIKRTVCKGCDEIQLGGVTSIESVENKSKGCAKPWADILVVRCRTCGTEKRFPVGMRILGVKKQFRPGT